MAICLNNFILGEYGGVNQNTGKIDVGGIFDVITAPLFPLVLPRVIVFLSFNEVYRDTLCELRINDPENEILAKIEFGLAGQNTDIPSKQIIQLESLPVQLRGKYTADVLEKTGAGYKFIKSVDLFTAMYPPKRKFSDEEIAAILSKQEELIVTVKTDYIIPGTTVLKKYQLNLDETAPIEDGYESFPPDNKVEIDGTVHDLEGLKRNVEWMFGREKPEPPEPPIEENVEKLIEN